MKTKEELNALKEKVETLNQKLTELTEEEMEQVSGGEDLVYCPTCQRKMPPETYLHDLNESGSISRISGNIRDLCRIRPGKNEIKY